LNVIFDIINRDVKMQTYDLVHSRSVLHPLTIWCEVNSTCWIKIQAL